MDISDPNGFTPEEAAPHAIEREGEQGAAPEPLVLSDPPPVASVEPAELTLPDSVRGPEALELGSPAPVVPVEPLALDPPESARGPEALELDPPESARGPEPIEPAPREAVEPVPTLEWDTGRNTAAPVDPIEWVNREQPLPPVPQITIDVPAPSIDPNRLTFYDGDLRRQTFYYVS